MNKPRNKIKDLFAPSARKMPSVPSDATYVDKGVSLSAPTAPVYELMQATPEIHRVVSSGPGYIDAEDKYGAAFRAKGTLPWRNNNPGNIKASAFANTHGSIGKAEKFAVFKSPKEGEDALRTLLFQPDSKYRNTTVGDAIAIFAPPQDKNDTKAYKQFVASKVGTNAQINKLNPSQREAMLQAIKQFEGYNRGGSVAMDGREWKANQPRAAK